ncbi:unnamed protein product [Clavelina lepadiformis]|uniref:Aminotransferase class I/classII large domain-containing protein n=2 Tax=Clavelina lepadiformis TaxID=159417 RepID=A0ABP0F4U9_CLALP
MDYNRFISSYYRGEKKGNYMIRKMALLAETVPEAVDLTSGMPSWDTFPISSATFKCKNGTTLELSEDEMKDITPYQSSQGMTELLTWIRKFHEKYHSPPLMDNENSERRFDICVTPGAMGAMSVLFPIIMERNDVVLLEEFNYPGTTNNIDKVSAYPIELSMDEFGVKPDALVDAIVNWKQKAIESGAPNPDDLNPPKVFYTVPIGHNPTGIVVPLQRKKEIYKIAQKYNLLIVEDDPYFYFQYDEIFTPSYQSIDVDGRVIRIDSMAKFFAPGLRIGWVTGPSKIIRTVIPAQVSATIAPGAFAQIAVLKLFGKTGMVGFQDRIQELKNFYKPKRDLSVSLLKKHLKDDVEWIEPQAGIFLWMKLKNLSDSMIFIDSEDCRKYGVFVVPGAGFLVRPKGPCPYLRISFTRMSTEDLEKGIICLSQWIKDATRKELSGI